MKKLFTAVFGILLGTVCFSQDIRPLALGSAIPLADNKLKDISGRSVSVNDAKQRNGVLVMFSCNTCPYVVKNQSRTLQLAAYAKQHNIGVILLNSNEGGRADGDSYSAMQSYGKEQGYDFYYALDTDSKLADAFGASRTPEIFLFDANGVLQYKGAIDDNPSNAGDVKRTHAKEAIQEMAAGKAVTVKESRSVGCGIKRS